MMNYDELIKKDILPSAADPKTCRCLTPKRNSREMSVEMVAVEFLCHRGDDLRAQQNFVQEIRELRGKSLCQWTLRTSEQSPVQGRTAKKFSRSGVVMSHCQTCDQVRKVCRDPGRACG